MRFFTALLCLLLPTISAFAVSLPPVIGNHMVLQRDLPVPIWGWGEKGEKITVSFAGQSKSATVGKNGKWMLKLDKLKANTKPSNLPVKGNNEIKLENILVGEVWICSGQSNMEWKVAQCANGKEEIAAANHSAIRLFDVPGHTVHPLPQDKGKGEWKVCSPSTIASFSATGYYFGRRLHKELNIPIGLGGSNWGGTRIEPWTTLTGFKSVPELSGITQSVEGYNDNTPIKPVTPTAIYTSMVHPLTPYALRGAIWYQGESNGRRGHAYREVFPLMIQSWRDAWKQGDFSFYWVQLADFMSEVPEPPTEQTWPELREAQTFTLDKLNNVGEAVIIDVGEGRDIHPRNKQMVANRLVRNALAKDYGMDLPHQSPRYQSMEAQGNKIILSFQHVGQGLYCFDVRDPVGFAICGEDQKFVWAQARLIGKDKVEVWADGIEKPVAARYAWADNPVCNLYRKDGSVTLPVTPFRTDDFPTITKGM